MEAAPSAPRVPAVVFDDGALTRAGLQRVARYASRVDLLGPARSDAPARLLSELGVPVHRSSPDAGLGDAADQAAANGAVLVTGIPIDPAAWLADVLGAPGRSGSGGLLAHLPAPGSVLSLQPAALAPEAATWAEAAGPGFASAVGLRPLNAVTVSPADAAPLLEAVEADRLLVTAAAPLRLPEHAAVPASGYPLTSADTILAVLTDTGLDVANRTPVSVQLRIRLGAAGTGEDLGSVEADLGPRETARRGLDDLRFLAHLERPQPQVRHWSHETETVYDGGDIRIIGLDVRYLDPGGATIALHSYGSRQGLHVGVTAPELSVALGTPQVNVAEGWRRREARRSVPLPLLLSQLAASSSTGSPDRTVPRT